MSILPRAHAKGINLRPRLHKGLEGKPFSSLIETTIRSFKRADLNSIEKIERRSFTDPWSSSDFESFHQRDGVRFFVAVRNTHIVGYIIVEVLEATDLLNLRIIKRGHLLNLAVDPKYRRQSVGKTLVNASLRSLLKERVQEIWLEVRASNWVAKRFYLTMGFREAGRKYQYYVNEDALIMKREL